MKSNKNTKILTRVQSKNVVLTYHNLPLDVKVSSLAIDVLKKIESELQKGVEVKYMFLSKEVYGKEEKEVCHLHGLVCLNKKVQTRSKKRIGNLFGFELKDMFFYPNVSSLVCYNGYLDYVKKLESEGKDDWFCKVKGRSSLIREKLDCVRENISKISLFEFNKVLEEFSIEELGKYSKIIGLFRSLIQSNKSKIEDLFFKKAWLKFEHKDYLEDKDYNSILGILQDELKIKRKSSPVFYGKSNSGKSSKIKAALCFVEEECKGFGKDVKFIIIKHLEDLCKFSFEELKEFDNVFLVFDDVSYHSLLKEIDSVKNLLEGSEGESSLRCLYGVFKFSKNVRKVFVMNNSSFKGFVDLSRFDDGIKERIRAFEIKESSYGN